jgi:hypothetical protein
MKLFDLGSHGSLVPVEVASNPDKLNLVAYGTLASEKKLCITVLNKEAGRSGRSANITINCGMPEARGKVIFMSAPGGDITTVKGVTIGGAEIKEDGVWDGKWSPLPPASKDGSLTVIVPAASAAVIELQGN